MVFQPASFLSPPHKLYYILNDVHMNPQSILICNSFVHTFMMCTQQGGGGDCLSHMQGVVVADKIAHGVHDSSLKASTHFPMYLSKETLFHAILPLIMGRSWPCAP